MVVRRLVDPQQLVSSYEFAERCGVGVDVNEWADGGNGMPAAVHAVGERRIRLWYWPEVKQWAQRRGFALTGDADVDPSSAHELLTGRQLSVRLEGKDPSAPRKMWRAGNGFPEPVNRYGRVWVWRWGDVERWARNARRRPGRRSRSPAD